ncbi:MAG: LamG-like jellyroll fold domain-containing protein [Candidatus Paceibacterota bacterium]|jgi:prepilin-type N-terminal cleavage/methylation domain-containing protein
MNRKGFTLIELLVVIAIVGILSSVIYTNITGLRDRAKVTAGIRFDSSTLHSIGDQLVGEWLFNEGANSAIDTSGAGNNAVTATWPIWLQTGGYNNKGAYSFNGSGYLDLPSTTNLNFERTNPFAISAWIKMTSSVGSIVSKMNNSTPYTGYDVSMTDDGKIMFFIINTVTTNEILVASIRTVNDDKWHHVAAIYDGSSSASGAKIYIDGSLSPVTTTYDLLTGSIVNAYHLHIGARTGGNNFIGSIDDVRIYSSALSGSDIQKLYADGISSHEVAAITK